MAKKVFISGASRGIGMAVADKFASQGYDLYLTCKKHVRELADYGNALSERYHIGCQTFACDMGNSQQVDQVFESIRDIDVVVNNAGISYVGLLTDMTLDEWNQVIQTNLNALFYVSRRAVPMMLRKKAGKIVNISSVWGNVGASMEVAYSTSKGGMNAFTKALAKELGPSNIQVNAVACGVIDTEMNQCFDQEERNALIQEIPADRMGKPEEVAELVLSLAQGPEYLTGQIITMDGGWI